MNDAAPEDGSEVHGDGIEDHGDGSKDHGDNSGVHKNGNEVHQDGHKVHQDGSEVHQDGSEIHEDGSDINSLDLDVPDLPLNFGQASNKQSANKTIAGLSSSESGPSKASSTEYHASGEDNSDDILEDFDPNYRPDDLDEEDRLALIKVQRFQKYEFRDKNLETISKIKTNAFDHDRSGNYEPNAKHKRVLAKKRKRSLSRPARAPNGDAIDSSKSDDEEGEASGSAPRRAKPMTYMAARNNGFSLVAVMEYKSEIVATTMRGYKDLDNWPDDIEYNFFDLEKLNLSDEEVDGSRYRFRKRTTDVPRAPLEPIKDPLGQHEDLRNHPVARSCVICRKLELTCSLVKNSTKWPCQLCVETYKEEKFPKCELIVPARFKAPCQSCQEDDVLCSFVKDPDQVGQCDNCFDTNNLCVAGPKPGTVERNTYELVYENSAAHKNRNYINCTACRRAKRKCSLKSKEDPPPCKSCKEKKEECDFKDLRKERARETIAMDEDDETQSQEVEDEEEEILLIGDWSRTPSPEPEEKAEDPIGMTMEDRYGNRGRTQRYKTRFAHPIHFFYEPQPSIGRRGPEQPCDFCGDPVFAICGLGPTLEPLVIAWYNGLGYTELDEGYRAMKCGATRICIECTFKRYFIVMCSEHLMVYLPNSDRFADPNQQIAASGRLLQGQEFPGEFFCSICLNPATRRCAAHKNENHIGVALDPREGQNKGCGLLLCEECVGTWQQEEEKGGSFQTFIVKMDERPYDPEGKVRADVCFLRKDGLLAKNVVA